MQNKQFDIDDCAFKVGVSYEFSRILKYFPNFFIRLHILLMLLKKFSSAAAFSKAIKHIEAT